MSLITTTAALEDFTRRIAADAFITVDTEFMRERTFWPVLCLIQIAGADAAAAIDPLAPEIDLTPLWRVMADPAVLKVFHAARQDIEIFLHLTGSVPRPLFDTQAAAMVCGFGDSVSYETLIARLTGARLDKSSRFTDWSQRPLTDRQLAYALSDVTHLRPAYEQLSQKLQKSGRASWLDEEMALLTDPATYRLDPDEAWRRLKPRSDKPRFLGVLREVAAWREREAQRKDIPRSRVIKDEALLEIAAHAPATVDDLARTRGLGRAIAEGRYGTELMAAVEHALALPAGALPVAGPRTELPQGLAPIVDLLRVLLKMKSEDEDVAARLIAGSADLEAIAADDDADVPALKGWRRRIFGTAALDLKQGRIALAVAGKRVRLVPINPSEA
jgi:ribonuclease D